MSRIETNINMHQLCNYESELVVRKISIMDIMDKENEILINLVLQGKQATTEALISELDRFYN